MRLYCAKNSEKRSILSDKRPFHNSDKLSISELKLAKSIVFKLIKKRPFSRFCSRYPSVFWGSLKSFLGVTKCPLINDNWEDLLNGLWVDHLLLCGWGMWFSPSSLQAAAPLGHSVRTEMGEISRLVPGFSAVQIAPLTLLQKCLFLSFQVPSHFINKILFACTW